MKALHLILAAVVAAGAAGPQSLSPRLENGGIPPQVPQAYAGGTVVLELAIDPQGGVTRVVPVTSTPPYGEWLQSAVTQWQFAPAVTVIDGRDANAAAPVLVAGVFRPPQFHAGTAPELPRALFDSVSARLPAIESLVLPLYPPTAIGDAIVIVEIEMSGGASPRGYRIVGPASGFDEAALDAVRAWRFRERSAAGIADRIFVYAVLGFRAPLASDARPIR